MWVDVQETWKNRKGKRSPLQITTGIVIKILSTQLFLANVSVSIPEITLCKNLIVSYWWFFKWFQPACLFKSCSCFSLHKRRKGLQEHRKHNLSNLNESGLKRSEQRAVCNEGKVMQKTSNKHCQKLETSLRNVIQFQLLEYSCRHVRKTFYFSQGNNALYFGEVGGKEALRRVLCILVLLP